MCLNRACLIWIHLHVNAAHARKGHEILGDRLRTMVAGETGSFPVLIRHLDLSISRLANEPEFTREWLYGASTRN